MTVRWLWSVVWLLCPVTSYGQNDVPPLAAPSSTTPEFVQVRVYAASEPKPGVLPLIYDPREQRPGNAAIDLFKAILLLTQAQIDVDPLAEPTKLTREQQAALVERTQEVYRYLNYAARCRTCDWQLPWNEEPPFSILLPELQQMRQFTRLLTLKCQVELNQDQLPAAVDSLRTSYALARHTASGPTLIHGLVAAAMIAQTHEQLLRVIQHPKCPCLYDAILSLPRPSIDLRPALRFESVAGELHFPQLKRLRDEQLTAAEASTLVDQIRVVAKSLADVSDAKPDPLPIDELKTWIEGTKFAAAKTRLSALGYDAGRIAAMPPAQVAILDSYFLFRRQFVALEQWFELPLDEAIRRETEFQARRDDGERDSPFDLFQNLLPDVARARKSAARVDRQLVALLAIEAIRKHAASHDGALPGTLEKLPEAAWLRDPLSGEKLTYQLQGDVARITLPAVANNSARSPLEGPFELRSTP